MTGYAYLDAVLDQPGSVIAMAHRGGALHPDIPGAENTLHAFRHAVDLGYHYLETDVHATSDGVLLAFHDAALDRVTDHVGLLADHTAEQVALARIAEEHAVPTMAELLEALPGLPVQHRPEVGHSGAPAGGAARPEREPTTGSASGRSPAARLNAFRRATAGRVATSATPAEVAAVAVLAGRAARRAGCRDAGALAAQAPADRPSPRPRSYDAPTAPGCTCTCGPARRTHSGCRSTTPRACTRFWTWGWTG